MMTAVVDAGIERGRIRGQRAVDVPFPRPASSQLTTSAPLSLTLELDDMKWAPSVANAV